MVLEAQRTESAPAGLIDGAPTRAVLPRPPSNREKYMYVRRELPLLMTASVLSVAMVTVSQIHFISLEWGLLALAPFLVFTMMYFLISLRVNATSRNFDLAAHKALVAGWAPSQYPDVDIFLPICNESLAVLHNTWTYVERLARGYRGPVKVLVLDDGDNPDAAVLAASFGFEYSVRPNRGWFKKAGNLRHGYHNSSSTFIAIFDADFAPRMDFLDELLPYMDQDPTLGIVQSPQFFRVDPSQGWIERGAGAVQELFYRVVQVSRDRLNGAICVGSCAVYRRKALDAIGGTTLIGHSEDVHTGFDLARVGWGLRYIPIALATGLCPDDPDSFLVQQYRWCSGSMSLLGSSKFWRTKLKASTRLCYLSGFCYYLHTAVFIFVTPLIPIVLIIGIPGQVHLRNYLWILPSTIYNLIIFPLWNRARYGPEALMTKSLYGWAHVFAVWDILRKKRMSWEATGGGAKKSTSRIWRAVALWGGTTSVVWIGVSAIRMVQYDPISFLFLLVAGLLYAAIVAMALLSRGSEKISPRLNELAARLVVLGRRRRVDVAGSE
jgi:cellulose synthase (UDP-forming)